MSTEHFPRGASAEQEAREAAAAFREKHGLGYAPLGDLVALIDLTRQVDVAMLDSGPDEHGMTIRDPERGVVMVAAARTRNPMRQRSTLAHELGHIVFDDYATPRAEGWGQRDPEEVRADAFARYLLVPLEAISLYVARKKAQEVSTLSALVQQFQASPQIVTIQLAEAGLISPTIKREWLATHSAPALAAKYGWSDQYRALQQESDSRRAPQRLLTRAVAGYINGTISLAYIARLRGIAVEEVAAEFSEQAITPAGQDTEPLGADELALLTPPENITAAPVDFSDLDALEADEADEPDE